MAFLQVKEQWHCDKHTVDTQHSATDSSENFEPTQWTEFFNVSQNMGLIKKPMGPKFYTQKRLTFRNLEKDCLLQTIFF